jgi:hypothetical protein
MNRLSRTDRAIVLGLVLVLAALLALALARRPAGGHAASAASRRASPASGAPSTAPGPPTTAPDAPVTTGTAPAATTSTAAPASTTTTTSPLPVPGPVSTVGDSIMLDIEPDLALDIPGARIDGLVSRQFESGIAVVQADRAAGTLGRVLVVELGTNGTVTPSDFDAMMQAASGVARVVFVNVDVPRPWEAPDNAVLAAGVARYPGVAVLADWYALSSGHPEWFTPDQVHLEPAGAQALAALVARYA